MDSNNSNQNRAATRKVGAVSDETLTDVGTAGTKPISLDETNLSGSTIGGYKLTRKIAEGGMGVVYEAIQLKLDRKVALKVLTQQLSSLPEFLKRFEREAKAAAALNHPNLVQVHDFGEDQSRYFMIMEFVDGEDLSDYVEKHGKLSVVEALEVIEQAASALKAAYDKTIIHRDIKPSNLMRTRDGLVKVADLGLAKMLSQNLEMTATGVGIGSPYFIAPEQAADASSVDHRADIYSLGITLLFLLTGKKPFDGATPYSIVLAHVNKDLPSGAELGTNLPPEVERLVQRMSAKDPEDRYQDYGTLLSDIRLVKAGAQPKLAPVRSKNPWRSTKAVSAGLAGVCVLVLLGIVWSNSGTKSSPPKKEMVLVPGTNTGEGSTLVRLDGEQTLRNPMEEPRRGMRPPSDSFGVEEFRPRGPRGREERQGPGGNADWHPYMRVMGDPNRSSRNPLEEGPIENMRKEAEALAAETPRNYIVLINAYAQLSSKATGSERREFDGQLGALKMEHDREAQKAIAEFTEKMNEKLRAGDKEAAHRVWTDFPITLRSLEVDARIVQAMKKALPELATGE